MAGRLVEPAAASVGVSTSTGRSAAATSAPDLHYLFAPLKQAPPRLHGAEGGGDGRRAAARRSSPSTPRSPGSIVERMEANAIEAAEQCGILSIPRIDEPVALGDLLDGWPAAEPDRRIVFCDEGARRADPFAILAALSRRRSPCSSGRRAASPRRSGSCFAAQPFVTAIRSAPASCAPIPRPSPPWRSFRPCSGTGPRRTATPDCGS